MNKRQRKKRLKKQCAYIPPSDIWNLDCTICKFIIPRLKLFRQHLDSVPVNRQKIVKNNEIECLKMEEWREVLDKMILSFETIIDDSWDDKAYSDPVNLTGFDYNKYKELTKKRQETIDEGLDLFALYFQDLWT